MRNESIRIFLLLIVLTGLTGCANTAVNGELQIINPAVEYVTTDRRPIQPDADMAQIKSAVRNGWVAWNAGDQAVAQQSTIEALQAGGNPETVLYLLGNNAAVSGDFNSARAYYENALKINPSNTKALYNLATVYLTKAEDHFNYYVASVSEHDVDRSLLRLLSDIDAFSQEPVSSKAKETTPLDSLRELFAQ